MLSDKKSIREIRKLTDQYAEHLTLNRAFFVQLSEIQKAQKEVLDKVRKAKKTTIIKSILEQQSSLLGDASITNFDLIRKDGRYFSLQVLEILCVLLTLPISLPLLIFWSKTTRSTFNFLTPNGSIIAEKIWALANLDSNKKLHLECNPLNTTIWINDMLNMTESHHRYRALHTNSHPRGGKPTFMTLHESDFEHETSPRPLCQRQ